MPPQRGAAISIGSVLFYIFGALGTIGSIFLLIASLTLPSLGGIPFIGGLTKVAAWILATFGAILLIPSVLAIIAGYLLWKGRRSGGIMGSVVSPIVLVVCVIILLYPVLWVAGIFGIAVSTVLMILVALGWTNLR